MGTDREMDREMDGGFRSTAAHDSTHRSPAAKLEVMKRSAQIRLAAINTFVLPNIEDGAVRFTLRDARDAARRVIGWVQDQHVRGALTPRKPLRFFGITWVDQGGFATLDTEVHWTWDPDHEILQLLLSDDDDNEEET